MSSANTFKDWVEQFDRETPEPRLELIAGRLVIGNSLAGSRYVLRDLVAGWGTEAALAFAPAPLWKAALRQGFAPRNRPALFPGGGGGAGRAVW